MKLFKNLVLVVIASMLGLNAEEQTTVYTESGKSYTITEPSLVCPADALPDDPSCVYFGKPCGANVMMASRVQAKKLAICDVMLSRLKSVDCKF
jgi:hypothetical protein